jgi:iron(III) transport system ATP-binding protein
LTTPYLKATQLFYQFDRKGLAAVAGCDFTVSKNEHWSIVGPSGHGKTTLLQLLAGFLSPQKGTREMFLSEEAISFGVTHVPSEWTVAECFGALLLRDFSFSGLPSAALQRWDERTLEEINYIRELQEQFSLEYRDEHQVKALSTGLSQRLKLALALVNRPKLVLLDEPLAHLDRELAAELHDLFYAQLQLRQVSSVLVTHSLDDLWRPLPVVNEERLLEKKIIYLYGGKIEQQGSLQELYDYPATPWVAKGLGDVNLVTGEVIANLENNLYRVVTAYGEWVVQCSSVREYGDFVLIPVRYAENHLVTIDRRSLSSNEVPEGTCAWIGKVMNIKRHQEMSLVTLEKYSPLFVSQTEEDSEEHPFIVAVGHLRAPSLGDVCKVTHIAKEAASFSLWSIPL